MTKLNLSSFTLAIVAGALFLLLLLAACATPCGC